MNNMCTGYNIVKGFKPYYKWIIFNIGRTNNQNG